MLIWALQKGYEAIMGQMGGYPEAVDRNYACGLAARAYREQWRTDPPNETVEALAPLVLLLMKRSGMFRKSRSKACREIAAAHRVDVWNKAAVAILKTFIKRLPNDVGVDATVMKVEAWSLANDRYALIEDLAVLLGRKSGDVMRVMPGWCEAVFQRLEKTRDVEIALLPSRDAFPRRWGKKPADLIGELFRGTPFADLMSVKLPMTIPDHALHCQMHGIAGVGRGKTTINSAVIMSYLGKKGLLVIDSKGGLADNLIRHSGRPDLIVGIEMTSPAMRPLFNAAQAPVGIKGDRVASTIAFILSGLGVDLTSQQMPTFQMVTRITAQHEAPTVDTMHKVMSDPDIAALLVENADKDTKTWFRTEFGKDETQRQLSEIARKLWTLKSAGFKRDLLCGPRNTLDLPSLLNDRKLVIVSIDKDKISAEDVSLAMRVILANANGAMWSRPPTPPKSMPDWLFVIDEYGDVRGEKSQGLIADIVTQGRQRRVSVLITHQQIDGQLGDTVESALLGNAAVKFGCSINKKDSEKLAGLMNCSAGDLQSTPSDPTRTFGQFIFSIQNYISDGAIVSVPFGHLESRPALTAARYREVMAGFKRFWTEINAQLPVVEPEIVEPSQQTTGGGNAVDISRAAMRGRTMPWKKKGGRG